MSHQINRQMTAALMSEVAQVLMPAKLAPVFSGVADVRGAYGGRGSAKTRSFAKMTAVMALVHAAAGRSGIILCGRQYQNSLDDSSLAEIKAAIESEEWLKSQFDIGEKYVRTKCGRVSYVFVGLDRNIDSIKSKSRILLAWVDEAEPVVEIAWAKLIPTLREEVSELWVTWNPERKGSATSKRFRDSKDPRVKIVELNWRDNPWFPDVLNRVRLKDKKERPDSYDHIWEGDYLTVVQGAYYAASLTQAKEEGRISRVSFDPLLTIRIHCDIGGTGAKADAFAMWPAQFIGREIRLVDYYEAQGQPLAAHLAWLRSKGYTPDKAQIVLPHDGKTNDRVYDVSYESAFREAGYHVEVIPNQGRGAAMMRVEAARRLFSQMWFDEASTEPGRIRLGAYHEKRDEKTGIGLGPNHDDASHAADAFGLLAVAYRPPVAAVAIDYSNRGIV